MAKKNRNNKNTNNYKIEALEPRLMMDGNQWGSEILSSGYDVVESASASYEKWESTKIDTVTLKDENSGEMSFASIKDFLDNENDNWNFTENSGKIDISVSLNRPISIDDEYQIVPDIAELTNIDVAFDVLNTKNDIRGESKVSFSIDGNALSEIDETIEIKAGFHFFQDVDDNKDAKIGILGLTSIADANESNPDLKIMGKYTLHDNASSYDTEFEYDLDFMVKDSSLLTIQNGFYVDDSNHLKYAGKSTAGPKWSSGSNAHDEDSLVPDFANVQMGEILNQFNAISKWLQKIESDILKNNFQNMIEQNASSFLRLSTVFENVIKTPPRSLQELVWGEYGGILPPFGVFVAGKTSFFVIFFLKIRTDFVPMNESDVKVKGPGPYSIARFKPRFMVDALSIEILLSKKV